MQDLQPDNLEANGYELHARLEHEDLMVFVKQYFFKKNAVMIFYWGFNLLMLAAVAYGMAVSEWPLKTIISRFFLGFALFFPIIPLHEWIHGIGYKLVGAPSVQYKAVWKQLVFYAMADRFVTRATPFFLLAVAPFILINSACIFAFFTLPPMWNWLAMGLLVMHTMGCSGDFALMSYFREFRHRDPVTFDEVDNKVSWFYLKKS